MPKKGYKGISFPFRFGGRGGVMTSDTSSGDFAHIHESLVQIIMTTVGERVFEYHFGSEVAFSIFDSSTDDTDLSILAFRVREAIGMWENRVEIEDLQIEVSPDSESTLYVVINFNVIKYMKSDTLRIPVDL